MAAVPQRRAALLLACLLGLAAGAWAQGPCTQGYFKMDLFSTTDTTDIIARCLNSVKVNLYQNCSVSLTPLSAAGSYVDAIFTGNAAASYKSYFECPLKEGALIAPSPDTTAASVRAAIKTAIEGHVYGFDATQTANNPHTISSVVYTQGVIELIRPGASGAMLGYAITERTIVASHVSGTIVPVSFCSLLVNPGTSCRDDSSAQGLGTSCGGGRYGIVVNDAVKVCAICPPGSTGNGYGCSPCGQGTVGPMLASSPASGTDCQDPCGPGFYGPTGSSHCLACQPGSYSDGSVNDRCSQCPPNSNSWVPGQSFCVKCVNGIPEHCTNAVCSASPPSPGGSIITLGRMESCSLSGLYELKSYTKCTTWAQAAPTDPRVQLALHVAGDCSIDVLPMSDPNCADPTSSVGTGYGEIQMRAYYTSMTTIRSVMHPDTPSGVMLSIDALSATDVSVKFWAGTLDFARANDAQITGNTVCTPSSATVVGGQVVGVPIAAISQCPPRSYNPALNPEGYGSSTSYCWACPPGSRCPGATGTFLGPVVACQPNEFTPYYGSLTCQTCDPTIGTSYAGATRCNVPIIDRDCFLINRGGIGEQYDPVSQRCQICPAGTHRDDTLKKCVFCDAGEYSGPGAAQCTKCPAGQYSPSTGLQDQEALTNIPGRHCLVCPRGSLALSGSQTASTVTTGQIVSGATFCDACPAGFVQDASQPLLPCVPCASSGAMGPYTYRTGDATPENNECKKIPAGYKLKPALNGVVPNTEIEMCEEGRVSFWDVTTGTIRTPNAQFNCIGCADLTPAANYSHTYAPHAGMIACIPCPTGTIPVSTGLAGSYFTQSCALCPSGFWRDTFTKNNTCTKCPAGKEAGPSAQGECNLCKAGSYMNTTMAGLNENFCRPCPVHQYRATPGGDTCLKCPRGFETQDTGNVECSPCAIGYYNNMEGTACDPAPAGTFVNTTATFMYKACPMGTFNEDRAGDTCSACPAGRYAPTVGSKECKTCPAGTFSLAQAAVCRSCRAGTSSPQGSNLCTPCKPGSYAPTTRLPRCLSCVKGYRCPTSGMRSLLRCPRGTFSNKEGSRECSPCPANTISTGGGTAASPLAVIACTKCPVGSNTQGRAGQSRCSPIRPQSRRLQAAA